MMSYVREQLVRTCWRGLISRATPGCRTPMSAPKKITLDTYTDLEKEAEQHTAEMLERAVFAERGKGGKYPGEAL